MDRQGLQPFVDVIGLEDLDDFDDAPEETHDCSADPQNPNLNDNRRLFQERVISFTWDNKIPYAEQPNRLELYGPKPLTFPDHFLQVEGGIVIIYFDKNRSTGCICEIKKVAEERATFIFQAVWIARKEEKDLVQDGKGFGG